MDAEELTPEEAHERRWRALIAAKERHVAEGKPETELYTEADRGPIEPLPVSRSRVRERLEPTRHDIAVKDWNNDAAARDYQ